MTLPQCSPELPNVAVSDTTDADSSNWIAIRSSTYFKELIKLTITLPSTTSVFSFQSAHKPFQVSLLIDPVQ
jgi:hypothetical protein